MAWYLYIMGIFVAIGLFSALNLANDKKQRVSPIVYILISAIWPVSFPALLVGGILTVAFGALDDEE